VSSDDRLTGVLGELPEGSFIDPRGGNRDAVRRLMHGVVDLVVDLASTAADRPPLPNRGDGEIPDVPIEGAAGSPDELLADLGAIMRPSANLASPGSMAHMDPPPTTASVLGDLVASALNNNLLFEELSPALTRLEDRLLRWMAGRFGLGSEAGGIMLPGGTLANLQALAVARNAAGSRLEGTDRRPAVVASESAHSSIRKAAMVLGLGDGGVLGVPTDDDDRLDPDRLDEILKDAASWGLEPVCLVATAGTTTTGSIDPLPVLAEIARERRLWFHVDAAFGGAAVFSSEHRHLLRGVEAADSIAFNPHKGLCVARTAAVLLLRRRGDLERYFRVAAPYAGGDRTERGEISLQGTSHADVLKLWLSLRHLGERGYARLIDSRFTWTRRLTEMLRPLSVVELACEPQTPLVCFRARPPSKWSGSSDEWNLRLRDHLLAQYGLFLSVPLWRGQRWLKIVALNPHADEEVVDRLATGIEDFYGRPPSPE
jgi:glutamate/tyrosine decarboxylase-like PLP-dependent enzyme